MITMHQLEVVLLILHDCKKRTLNPNRTQIQKMVYFASEPLQLKMHRPHYYGPYSVEVTDAIRDLVSSNLVTEDCDIFDVGWDNDIIKRYSYELTDQGNEITRVLIDEYPTECKEIFYCMERLQTLGIDQRDLSNAAKIHFILKRHHDIHSDDIDGIVIRAEEFGWKIPEDQVIEKVQVMGKLGLLPA
jgi:uncharacterized protein YwgA